MLKILMRVFVILLAAGLISGALYWVVDSNSAQAGRFTFGSVAGLGSFGRSGSFLSIFSGGQRERNFLIAGAVQTLALTDILVKLGLIGLMTMVVVWLQRSVAHVLKRRKSAKAVGGSG